MNEIEQIVKDIMKTGVKFKDAFHLSSAIFTHSDYLLTTDKRLLKYQSHSITLINPIDFIRIKAFAVTGSAKPVMQTATAIPQTAANLCWPTMQTTAVSAANPVQKVTAKTTHAAGMMQSIPPFL